MKARHILTLAAIMASITASAQTTIWRVNDKFYNDKSASYTYRYDNVDSITLRDRRMVIHSGKRNYGYTYPKDGAGDRFLLQHPRLSIWQVGELDDYNDPNSTYCYARSKESEHFIVFWQKEFGSDPTKAKKGYAFDPQVLLDEAEKIYQVNTEKLGFGDPKTSTTLDHYKGELFVLYQTNWLATGSGYDNKIQAFWCNPTAVNDASTVGHEIGHTFQYMVYCDLGDGHGWRQGFGPDGRGGNMFWESCAQWQSYQVYPYATFQGWYYSYPGYSYMNQLHEVPRYSNYFFQYYWCQLHGQDFIGKLWRSAVYPEDPIDAYKRITETSQSQYCDEMNDYARRAVTWDIDGLRDLGKNNRDAFETSFHDSDKGWIEVDSSNCVQNYGFNVYRLNLPSLGNEIKVNFRGEAGKDGFRKYRVGDAGWRYSFAALLKDDSRVYSEIGRDSVGSLSFTVPDNTKQLWLVVSGAPKNHFHHEWNSTDDTPNTGSEDDEQWPYAFKLEGTDVQGHITIDDVVPHDTIVNSVKTVPYEYDYPAATNFELDLKPICESLGVKPEALMLKRSTQSTDSIKLYTVNADTLTNNYSSKYSLTFYYDKDGKVMPETSSNDSLVSYYVIYSAYGTHHTVYLGERAVNLKKGESFTFPLVFVREAYDGKRYTARINYTLKVE